MVWPVGLLITKSMASKFISKSREEVQYGPEVAVLWGRRSRNKDLFSALSDSLVYSQPTSFTLVKRY
jgi:hypothetical protein